MPVEHRKYITREMLRAERDKLFVFGDNLARAGLGGQAREMRFEPNAVGLPTKHYPKMTDDSFFRDQDIRLVVRAVRRDWQRLLQHVIDGGTVVWPEDGIGSGRAELAQRAPEIDRFYKYLLLSLK